MVHHAREEMNRHCFHLHVRSIVWTEDCWPLVSPERYSGEPQRMISPNELAGEWEWIVHDPRADSMVDAIALTLQPDGSIDTGIDSSLMNHGWRVVYQATVELQLSSHTFGWESQVELWTCRGTVLPAWDWERERAALVFTGLTGTGAAVWGKQISQLEA
ncbi:lipocalin-like domain-containing protein [Paenibacillus sp. FJAT-27812]|uniref:lipocalin-like domain-containing protein n=1 Tax=Paenibacillus sp. FJAT-27812 TaxID=1684143 RepID=UPI000AE6F742|nr:glycoside hydrolase family 43 C-terminal domain-containing protein [Paenibacillus sp. FJAT-27812]